MWRLMVGLFAGLLLGRNCSRLALKGSRVLRQLADRLDRLATEPQHTHPETIKREKEMIFRPAA